MHHTTSCDAYLDTNWIDNKSIHWTKRDNKWINPIHKVRGIKNPVEKSNKLNHDEMIVDKRDKMIGKQHNSKMSSLQPKSTFLNDKNTKISICTDTIQNDTGTNKVVTNNKEIMYAYHDIDPYPIGGVKADNVVITCTGEGLLPWETLEVNIIIMRTLYYKDVDGTIISPTTVAHQNKKTIKDSL